MHAKLSSLIRSKRRTNTVESTNISPFHIPASHSHQGRSFDSAHPYASPQYVYDITPDNTPRSSIDIQPSETLINPSSPGTSSLKQYAKAPIQLDLDFGNESLSESVPSYLLRANSRRLATTDSGDSTPVDRRRGQGAPFNDNDDDSVAANGLITQLEGMRASNFMHLGQRSRSTSTLNVNKIKRLPPSPIEILEPPPNERTAKAGELSPVSEPSSASSFGAASSVSGSSIARALMANTYALSVDTDISSFANAGLATTRADSATLPMGDHEWFPADDAPPVPPKADIVYVAPQIEQSYFSTNHARSQDELSTPKISSDPISTTPGYSERSILPEPIGSPLSMASTDDLDEYYSASENEDGAARSAPRFRVPFTPIVEESASQMTSSPLSSQWPSRDVSDYVSSSATGSAPVNWAGMRRPSYTKRESSIDGRTAALFPIGVQSPSILSPPRIPSPIVRNADGQLPSPGPSLHRRDLSLSQIQSTKPAGLRDRSESLPSPISVDRDTRDRRKYLLNPVSNTGDVDIISAPSSSDHGHLLEGQTFPETARSRMPSWDAAPSPELPTRGSYDKSRFPQTPSTAGIQTSMTPTLNRTPSNNASLSGRRSASDSSHTSNHISPGYPGFRSVSDTLPLNYLLKNTPSSRVASPPPHEGTSLYPPSSFLGARSQLAFPTTPESAKIPVSGSIQRPHRGISANVSPPRKNSAVVGGPRPKPSNPRSPGHSQTKFSLEPKHVTNQSAPQASALSSFSSYPTPLFVTPESNWKGHTLDAAIWTFSSETLQEIVAQAIRQSASESKIRLLKPETLNEDIPAEIESLESRQSSIQAEYRYLCHKRSYLLRELSIQPEADNHPAPTSGSGMASIAKELRDMCISLDKLAEDLHSVDEQLGQLRLLREIHSTSALAMALRKLNSSLLRQTAENRQLQEQVRVLEDERDDGWSQAQVMATELDDMVEASRHLSMSSVTSRNSSRLHSAKLASHRVSTAGLRRTASHRASVSSSLAPPFRLSVDAAPPLPVPPSRAESHNKNNLSSRSSRALSLDGSTPGSEYRQMMTAQDELLDLLGLTEHRDGRRPERNLRRRSSGEYAYAGIMPDSARRRPYSVSG